VGASTMQAEQVVHEEEQQEVQSFRLVEDLQSVGVNMSEIKKLQDAGLATVGSVLQQPMKELIAIKGFSEGKCSAITASAPRFFQVNPANVV
jgi:hypothetical protein